MSQSIFPWKLLLNWEFFATAGEWVHFRGSNSTIFFSSLPVCKCIELLLSLTSTLAWSSRFKFFVKVFVVLLCHGQDIVRLAILYMVRPWLFKESLALQAR